MSRPDDETIPGVVLAERESLAAGDDEPTKVDGAEPDAEAATHNLGNVSKDIGDLMGDLQKMKKSKLPF